TSAAGRASGGLQADGQRDRDRQVRSQPAAGVPDRRRVRRRDRIDFLPRGGCMTPKLPVLAPVLLVAALAGCDAGPGRSGGPRADAQGALHYGDIVFAPCALTAPGRSVEAQCAKIEVPENHDAPEGRRIELALALIPASGSAEADPIFMIAGGPGQSAIESYPMVEPAFDDVDRNRHMLLLDARGTGGSHPLHCKGADDLFSDPANETPDAARR